MQLHTFRSLALTGFAFALLCHTGGRVAAAPADNRELANRLVARFVEAENTMNVALFDQIFPANYIQHNPDVPPGLSGVKKAFADEFAQMQAAHIVAHSTIESVVVDGDMVVLRQLTTIDKGPKHYVARGIDEWRIVDGRLGEHWDCDSTPRPIAAGYSSPSK
jgi:predicted SnoaL-like aldol condensation-catalyzing enzyme